jgi:xylan 1,4-beta-xylosidase
MTPTVFTCNFEATGTPLPHFWEHTIGSGHATLALRADYQAQLTRCARELGVRHVRFHGLLSDDVGTLIVSQGKKGYSFLNADNIVDFLLGIGMKPFIELSFMPSCIAKGDQRVMHYQDIVTPPAETADWTELIDKLVRHWVDRYGVDEVRTWPFEVWNEPNIPAFWSGDQQAYFDLFEATFRTIKTIDPRIRVGGPATAACAWIDDFVGFCRKRKLHYDFLSTHLYPTDALGSSKQDTRSELAHSGRDVMHTKAASVRKSVPSGRSVYFTEWSSSSNSEDPLHDESFAAAFAARTMLENNGLVDAYSWWTFSDIFSESYFHSQPFHGGFGLLTAHGIAKPSYRAFELLHGLATRCFK